MKGSLSKAAVYSVTYVFLAGSVLHTLRSVVELLKKVNPAEDWAGYGVALLLLWLFSTGLVWISNIGD